MLSLFVAVAVAAAPACEGTIIGNGEFPPPGSTTSGSGGAGASCVPSGVPSDIQALFSTCSGCHGSTPLPGAPALVTYADLTAPASANPAETNAQRALARLQSTTNPMPPAGSPGPSATEVAALQTWIGGGYPMAACQPGAGGTGGLSGGGSTGGSDPFAAPSVCTSKATWQGGNRESPSMNPGQACISCHQSGEGPRFAVAGTLYPTAHEPDLCNGTSGSMGGAQIVITDSTGKVVTLAPNSVGNFSYQGALSPPFSASVTYMGRERRMVTAQTNGDCNACHTTSGAMGAPGRILLP